MKAQIRKAWLWSRRNPVTVALLVAAVFTYGTVMDTRDDQQVTQRIVEKSPCTIDPAGRECQQLRNVIERNRPVRETCIPFRRVGYRCPVGDVRRGVVRQQGSSPSQPSGPSGGRSTSESVPSVPEQPENGNKPAPSPPAPEPEPVAPEPVAPEPVTPEPSTPKPLIDLTPVTDPVCELTRPVAAIC